MSAQDRIIAATARNAELLGILNQTDYAVSAVQQQSAYTADLNVQQDKTNSEIKSLESKFESSKHSHEKYQTSTMRRFAYKATGRGHHFEEKASHEEQEYFHVLQALHHAKARQEDLSRTLYQAQTYKAELDKVAEQHAESQQQLDGLYESIFSGATPEFPEEDMTEEAVKQAGEIYNEAQSRLNIETQATRILRDAEAQMVTALQEIDMALERSNLDVMGFGGAWADYSERKHLTLSENALSKVYMTISQAMRVQPAIEPLPVMKIASNNIVSDVIFDNIFSDLSFQEKICTSRDEVVKGQRALGTEIEKSVKREQGVQDEVTGRKQELDWRRHELQKVRERMMQQVLSQGYYNTY